MNDNDFSHFKRALIVGAGAGLSASLARTLADAGLKVALAARTTADLGALAPGDWRQALHMRRGQAAEVEKLSAHSTAISVHPMWSFTMPARGRGAAGRPCSGGSGARHRRQRVRRLSGGAASGAPDAAGKTRRDHLHGCVGECEGLPAVGNFCDGQVRLARARSEHGA